MIDILKKIIDENILNEILLAIVFFICSIIFAVNEENMDKEYQKKYITTSYLLYFLFFVLLGTDPKTIYNSTITFLFIALLLNVICGINFGYKADNLSKFLGRRKLVLFKTLEWFFITKSYIFYIFIFTLKILSGIIIKLNISIGYLYYYIFFVFFTYHLLSNMIDTFGIYSFNYLSNLFFDSKEYFASSDYTKMPKEDLIYILGFIVFVEDKDFFDRKGAVFSPYYVFKRKMCNLETSYEDRQTKEQIKVGNLIEYYITVAKYAIRLILRVFKNIKSYIRGFSTIEQQIVRVTIMKPDTFEKYIFRRKIFVEWIANPMFFNAFRKRRKVVRRIKNIDGYQYKVEFLLFYYNKILEMPKNMEELIEKLYLGSRLSRERIKVLLSRYNSSKLKIKYNKILEEELNKLEIGV